MVGPRNRTFKPIFGGQKFGPQTQEAAGQRGNVVSPFMFGLGCGQDLWKRRITFGDRMSESRANEPRFPRKLGHTTGTFYWDQDDELTGLNIGFCM